MFFNLSKEKWKLFSKKWKQKKNKNHIKDIAGLKYKKE